MSTDEKDTTTEVGPLTDHTYFMRCGDCHTMYEVRPGGISLRTGEPVGPDWVRPRTIRKPKWCDHPPGRVEAWIDGRWRTMPHERATS